MGFSADLDEMQQRLYAWRDGIIEAGYDVIYCMFTIDATPIGSQLPNVWAQLRRPGVPTIIDVRVVGDNWLVIRNGMDEKLKNLGKVETNAKGS